MDVCQWAFTSGVSLLEPFGVSLLRTLTGRVSLLRTLTGGVSLLRAFTGGVSSVNVT